MKKIIMKIEIVEELQEKYTTTEDNKKIVNDILTICYDIKNNRLAPKRSLDYINKNDLNLYTLIVDNTEFKKISEIIKFFIYNRNIPLCKTCKENNIIVGDRLGKNYDYCSNKCTIKSNEVQEKTKKTCISRYGKRFKHERKDKYILGEHHTQKNINNLDDVNDREIMESLQNKGDWRTVAEHFNLTKKSHSSSYKFMRKYGYDLDYKTNNVSNPENEIYDFLISIIPENEIIRNSKKIIPPYEIDIYIPKYKLAIEYNGLYWHSSNDISDDLKFKNMHINKTEMCEKVDINLLHIFENEWLSNDKKDIWKSLIKSKLNMNERIYARKCIVKDITNSEAKQFCEENHLQAFSVSTRSKGLFHNDELVMVASFSKPRYNKNYDNELIRLCSKKYLNIIGGASKILHGEEFISYANRRWSYGNVYNKLGMIKIKNTSPSYYYLNNQFDLYHRSTFMKHKLKEKLINFDSSKSESINMYNNKYRRIWDCGNILYSNYKNNNGEK